MAERPGTALKRIEFLMLAVLAEGPLHGYGIAQEIQRRTGGREPVRPGSLYRVLDRLQRRKLLARAERRPLAEQDDERRTYYAITPEGRRAVVQEARLLSGVAARVVDVSDDADAKPA